VSAPAATAPATAILAALRAGRVSSESLVAAALARIADVNPRLNAVVALDAAGALAAARAADAAAQAGRPRGPLHGLPVTIKDCFEVAGLPATNGATELTAHRPVHHAAAVQRLVDAGAVVVGKTNVPLYSGDLQTFNDLHGITRNPWDPARTPGGSSGGAAVAVATGIAGLELGSDFAGSLRIPAHATGVCALKPGPGIVPPAGMLWPGPGVRRTPDLVVAGPLARSVGDLGLALDVLAGPSGADARAWQLRLPPARAPARSLRVAAWLDDASCPVDAGVAAVTEAACAGLAAAGVRVDRAARPDLDAAAAFRDFFELLYGEMSAGFPAAVYRAFARAARQPAAEWTPLAAMPAAVTQSHRDWLAASERRAGHAAAWDRFFERHDALVAPVAPTTAAPHDHRPFEQRTVRLGGRERPYMQQAFWCALATVAGLPAVVVPAGLAADGLPVGLQVIGPRHGERTALELAALVESVTGGYQAPPGA
jgi:amidase